MVLWEFDVTGEISGCFNFLAIVKLFYVWLRLDSTHKPRRRHSNYNVRRDCKLACRTCHRFQAAACNQTTIHKLKTKQLHKSTRMKTILQNCLSDLFGFNLCSSIELYILKWHGRPRAAAAVYLRISCVSWKFT